MLNIKQKVKLARTGTALLAGSYWCPKRFIFSVLSFTACSLAVSFNVNLSIAIVSMLPHNSNATQISNETDTGFRNISLQQPVVEENKLHWSGEMEGMALGAVYYGQLVSFIPGGRMAELYGGKRTMILCTLVSSVTTLLLPATAFWCPFAFIAMRFLVGIGTGPIIPIVFYMLSKWIPEQERSFHASFILSGYGIGSFLAVIVSGALCGTTFFGGWPSVFYLGGFFGILWCLMCAYLMHETPENHPTMNVEELYYIISGIGDHKEKKILSIPWRKMAFSLPLWALGIGFFGQFWLLGFFSTVHSIYMGTVLNLPIIQNGVLSCLPHLLRAFATCFASYPVDLLLKNEVVTVGFVRKGATLINTVVSCAAFLGVALVGRNVTATTILFILGGVFGEFVTFGVCLACIDIAPNISGTVSGILNIIGVLPFLIIPSLVGWMTNFQNTIEEWRKVFYITAFLVSITTAVFVAFGDLRPQPWGVVKTTAEENKEAEQSENKGYDASLDESLY